MTSASAILSPQPQPFLECRLRDSLASLSVFAQFFSHAPRIVTEQLEVLEYGLCTYTPLLDGFLAWYNKDYQSLKNQAGPFEILWVERLKTAVDEIILKIEKDGRLGQTYLLNQLALFLERHKKDMPDSEIRITKMRKAGHCDGFSFLDTYERYNGRNRTEALFKIISKWNGKDDSLDKRKSEIFEIIDLVFKSQHPRSTLSLAQGQWHKISPLVRHRIEDRVIKRNGATIVPEFNRVGAGEGVAKFIKPIMTARKASTHPIIPDLTFRMIANIHATVAHLVAGKLIYVDPNSEIGALEVKLEWLPSLLLASHPSVLKEVKAAHEAKEILSYNPLTITQFSSEAEELKFAPSSFSFSKTVNHGTVLFAAIAADSKEAYAHSVKKADLKSIAKDTGYTFYHEAASWNSVELIAELSQLTTTPDINAKSKKSQRTALMMAARYGFVSVTRKILALPNVDVDAKVGVSASKYVGLTAAHLAARKGHYEVVKEIFSYNPASIRAITPSGVNVINAAEISGCRNVRILIEMLLWKAIEMHYEIEAISLLAQTALNDVNAVEASLGLTKLHIAARNGLSKLVEAFLGIQGIESDTRATSQAESVKGWTPLHIAIWFGQLEVVKTILRLAPRNAYSLLPNGMDTLQLATEINQSEIRNVIGHTLLERALQNNDTEAAIRLLSRGLDISEPSALGDYFICQAARVGNHAVVEYLLNAKANVNISGPDGTALQIAVERNDVVLAKFLIARGAGMDVIYSRSVEMAKVLRAACFAQAKAEEKCVVSVTKVWQSPSPLMRYSSFRGEDSPLLPRVCEDSSQYTSSSCRMRSGRAPTNKA